MAVFDGSVPVADHAFLCEMDLGTAPILWTPHISLVYVTNVQVFQKNVDFDFGYGCFGWGSFGGAGTAQLGRTTLAVSVGSFFADGEEYTERASIALVQSNAKSWYFDNDTQKLYVHFDGGSRPTVHYGVTIGATAFYSDKAVVIENQPYKAKILDYDPIEKSRDPLDYGVIEFSEGSVEISNTDGDFDRIKDQYIMYGQVARTYIGVRGAVKADFYHLNKGYLSDFKYDSEKAVWTINDNRKKLSREIPFNQYEQTTYPYLADKNVGKWISWIFGKCYGVECMCTNDEEPAPASYSFKVADVTDHTAGIVDIMQVYVAGEKVTHGGESLTAATFTLTTSQYSPGQKVTIDVDGFDYDNPFDLIKHLLADFADIAYNTTNYDTTEWAAATAHEFAFDIGVCISKRTAIIKVIEMLMPGTRGMFFFKDSGKITARIVDTSAAVTGTIGEKEIIGEPVIEYDGIVATSVEIGYAKDQAVNVYRYSEYNDEEENYQAIYKKYEPHSFDTAIVNEADAQRLALDLFNYLKNEKRIIAIEVGWQAIGIEPGDLYNFEINRVDSPMLGIVKTEIIGVGKDAMHGLFSLTGREI